jgi:hypothetical protein
LKLILLNSLTIQKEKGKGQKLKIKGKRISGFGGLFPPGSRLSL